MFSMSLIAETVKSERRNLNIREAWRLLSSITPKNKNRAKLNDAPRDMFQRFIIKFETKMSILRAV